MDKKQQPSRKPDDDDDANKDKNRLPAPTPGPSGERTSRPREVKTKAKDQELESKRLAKSQKKDFGDSPSDIEDDGVGSGDDFQYKKNDESMDSEEFEEKTTPKSSKKRKRSPDGNASAEKRPTNIPPDKKIKKEPKTKLFKGKPIIVNRIKPRYLNGVRIEIPQRIKFWPDSNDYADEPEEVYLWCRFCPSRIWNYANWNAHLKQHLSFILDWIFRVWSPVFKNAYGHLQIEVTKGHPRNVNDGYRCPLAKIPVTRGKKPCSLAWMSWCNDTMHRHLIFDHGILNRVLTNTMLIPRTSEREPISLNFEFQPNHFGPPPVQRGRTWALKNTKLIDPKTGLPFKSQVLDDITGVIVEPGVRVDLETYCRLIGQPYHDPEAVDSNLRWNRLQERWNEQEETHGTARINLRTGIPATPYHHGKQDLNGNRLPLRIHDRTMMDELEIATESRENTVVQGQFSCCQKANEDNQRLNADNVHLHEEIGKIQMNSAKNAEKFNNSVADLRKKVESLQEELRLAKESEAKWRELRCGFCTRTLRCDCQDLSMEGRTNASTAVDTEGFDNEIGNLNEDGSLFNDPSLLINNCKNCKRGDGMLDGDMCHLCKLQIPANSQSVANLEEEEIGPDGQNNEVVPSTSTPEITEESSSRDPEALHNQVPEASPSTSTAMNEPPSQQGIEEHEVRGDDYVLDTTNITKGLFGATFDRLKQVEFDGFPNPLNEEQFRDRMTIMNRLANATINELNSGNSKNSKKYLAQMNITTYGNVILLMVDQLQKMMARVKANEDKINETVATQHVEIARLSSLERQLDSLPNAEKLNLIEEEINKLKNIIKDEKQNLEQTLKTRRRECDEALEKLLKLKEGVVDDINSSLKMTRKDAAEKERKLEALNTKAGNNLTNLKTEISNAEKVAKRNEAAAIASASSNQILEKSIDSASKMSTTLNDVVAKGDTDVKARVDSAKTQADGVKKEVKKLDESVSNYKSDVRKTRAVAEKLSEDVDNNARKLRELDRQARHMDRYGDMDEYDYGDYEPKSYEDLRGKLKTNQGRRDHESPRRSRSRRSRSRSEDRTSTPKKKQKARHSSSRDRKEVKVHAPIKIGKWLIGKK